MSEKVKALLKENQLKQKRIDDLISIINQRGLTEKILKEFID